MCHVEESALILLKTEEPRNSFKLGNNMTRLSFQKRPFCLHQIDEIKESSGQKEHGPRGKDKDIN